LQSQSVQVISKARLFFCREGADVLLATSVVNEGLPVFSVAGDSHILRTALKKRVERLVLHAVLETVVREVVHVNLTEQSLQFVSDIELLAASLSSLDLSS
jgi:hypothetical protein